PASCSGPVPTTPTPTGERRAMSELTVTVLRLGYLVVLWLFVFSTIGVLRRDLYGTKIVRRLRRESAQSPPPAPTPEPAGPPSRPAPGRAAPGRLVVTSGPLRGTTLPLGASRVVVGRAPSCPRVPGAHYPPPPHPRGS